MRMNPGSAPMHIWTSYDYANVKAPALIICACTFPQENNMRIKSTASLPFVKTTQLVAIAILVVGIALGTPASARAGAAGCAAATKAATLQSNTPFHATYTVTPVTPGAFPTEHHEETWVGKTMYTKLGDGRWMHVPVTNNPMGGFTGPLTGFSDCRPLPAASIRGETAPGYDFKMESGRRTKIWISPKSGLPVRYIVDQDILLATIDVDYANVNAPAK
jgi:hypothetical protein